jgi:hypothetical protein
VQTGPQIHDRIAEDRAEARPTAQRIASKTHR